MCVYKADGMRKESRSDGRVSEDPDSTQKSGLNLSKGAGLSSAWQLSEVNVYEMNSHSQSLTGAV